MKKLFYFLLVILFALLCFFSYNYMKKSISYNYKEPNIEQMVQAKLNNGYLDKKIVESIKRENFDDVNMYVALSERFGIELNKTTQELIKQNNTTTKKVTRGIKNFVDGFIGGKAKNGTQLAGAITSDFTLYGDLRDINREGQKYIKDEPYDKLILGLSMAGLTLSVSQLITLGTSSSLKVGTSALKLAKKEKVLTKNFSKVLGKKLDKSVNFKVLKNIKYGSIKEIKNSAKLIKNSVNLAPLKPIAKDLKTIKGSTSLNDTVKLLKYVDSPKDLKAVAKLSKRYKSATKGVFKLLGKNSFRLVKTGIKWSKNLILSTLALTLSAYGFLISIFRLFFK